MTRAGADQNPVRSGVWITAYSSVSALGQSIEQLRTGLVAGCSGLSEAPALPLSFDPLPFTACLGIIPGELSGAPACPPYADTRQLRMAWAALRPIEGELRDAIFRYGGHRVGLILGTSTGGIMSTEEALIHYGKEGCLPEHYSCLHGHTMDAVVRHISQSFGIFGPAFATSSACASGAKALASAKRLIELGLVDAVLAGGIDSLARMTVYGFHSLGVLSETNCRPFDPSSFGMNVAEGGAWLLLQRSDESTEPKARLSLIGIGESSDAHHMSAPDPDGHGQKQAMLNALQNAKLLPADIAYINAHGTGTRANDTAEQQAIEEIFGSVATSSTKGLIGHQLGAAGATEAIIAAEVALGLALCPSGSIEPKHFPLDGIEPPSSVLSNSFAFGGANISLVLQSAAARTMPAPLSTSLVAHVRAMSALALNSSFISLSSDLNAAHVLDPKAYGTSLLGARGRARASELTRLFAESISWLGLHPDELAEIPIFVGSALGQIQTSKNLIDLFLAGDASPLAFQGSVHNAVAGIVTIALKNHKPSSSIAAGSDTLFATLLEALAYLDPLSCPQVLVLVGDEKPPTMLGLPHFETATIALLLCHPSVADSGQRLEIRTKDASLEKVETRILTPAPLQGHICGEGPGLIQWLMEAPLNSTAVVHRSITNSPLDLIARTGHSDSAPKDSSRLQGEHVAKTTEGANLSVADLLPHDPPLLLLSKVLSFDETHMTSEVNLQANEIFENAGEIDAIVATEWMAQTVGAYVGAKKRREGQPPKIGFIIGVRKVDFHVSKVKKNANLQVTVTPVWVDSASGSFNCTVTDVTSQTIIAEGSLTVHEP